MLSEIQTSKLTTEALQLGIKNCLHPTREKNILARRFSHYNSIRLEKGYVRFR